MTHNLKCVYINELDFCYYFWLVVSDYRHKDIAEKSKEGEVKKMTLFRIGNRQSYKI